MRHVMPVVVVLILAVSGVPAPAADWVSASPRARGFVYNVYAPLYGRELPEVKCDTNFLGRPLALDGHSYERGFGGQGYAIVEVDVPADATGLAATIGIDDQDMGAGNGTIFSIWENGRRLWESPALCRSDPALTIHVPLPGLRAIKLITDAQGYRNQDLADWCEVRWLREPAPPLWRYTTAGQPWQVRAELYPFSLAYRGEKLPLTVLGPAPAAAELACVVTDDTGRKVLENTRTLALKPSEHASAMASPALDLASLPNGIYDLRLEAASGGQPVAARTLRFGLITSRLGRPSQGTIYGVNHHEFLASYEPLAAIGCEYARQWFCWAWIEPKPGEWHWSWHDERMAAAQRFGVKTIGVLGGIGQPAWSSPDHVEPGKATTHGCPANMAAWEEYVRAVATRYKGQITVWESWNEIMGPAQRELEGWSVARYVDLHRRTYRVLREIDPHNKLLLSADGLGFVQQCLDAGVGAAFDGIVPHPYRNASTPEASVSNFCVGAMGDVASVFSAARSWLEAHQHPQAGIWATEIGWSVAGAGWVTVPLQTHGEYVPRSYQLAQASGQAANLSWHDFAHFMFGLADPGGVPRPALLSYAGMVPRLTGATLVKRLALAEPLHALLFRRPDTEMLTLCAEQDVAFAFLKPPAPMRLRAFDWYGNETALHLPAAGRAVPVDGRIVYLEGPAVSRVQVAAVAPLALSPAHVEAIAGAQVQLVCSIENAFGEPADFAAQPGAVEGLRFADAGKLRLAPGQRGEICLVATVARDAAAGWRAVPVAIAVPGGASPVLRATVRVIPPVSASLRPCDCARLSATPLPAQVELRNAEGRPLSGEVALTAPPGLKAEPATLRFTNLAGLATQTLDFALTAARPVTSADRLTLRVNCADGAHTERAYSLAPTVLDRDGNGVADGWKLNPEGGPPEQRNLGEASIEPGDSEFFCQKIKCTRFGGGWIILHRDGQDQIAGGQRYRVTFRARAEGLKGTVGVAVYNIQPWQSCGLESHYRIGPDWQTVQAEFTAKRDSDNVRFEVYFTEVGTVWLEGMRLQQLP